MTSGIPEFRSSTICCASFSRRWSDNSLFHRAHVGVAVRLFPSVDSGGQLVLVWSRAVSPSLGALTRAQLGMADLAQFAVVISASRRMNQWMWQETERAETDPSR